jgi:hypothetical protein
MCEYTKNVRKFLKNIKEKKPKKLMRIFNDDIMALMHCINCEFCRKEVKFNNLRLVHRKLSTIFTFATKETQYIETIKNITNFEVTHKSRSQKSNFFELFEEIHNFNQKKEEPEEALEIYSSPMYHQTEEQMKEEEEKALYLPNPIVFVPEEFYEPLPPSPMYNSDGEIYYKDE